MNDIWQFLSFLHIDPVVVLIVIGSGYFQLYYLKTWTIDKALKTLVVSFLVCLIYFWILYLNGNFPREVWANYFLSYFLATSLYELIIAPVTRAISKRIKKVTGDDTPDQQSFGGGDDSGAGGGGDRPKTPPINP